MASSKQEERNRAKNEVDTKAEVVQDLHDTSKRVKRRHFLTIFGATAVSLTALGSFLKLSGHNKIVTRAISVTSQKDKAQLNGLKQQYVGEANLSLEKTVLGQGVSATNANTLSDAKLLEASVPQGQTLTSGTTQLLALSTSSTSANSPRTNSTIENPISRMQADLQRALAKPVDQRRWGMVIDLRKCVGCSSCTVACKAENKLPPGVVYRPVIVNEVGTYPNVSMQFVPRPCMQCDKPPCVSVCPVGATYKRPDGIVAIDYDVCIGCRYCITACPYQARTFDFGLYYTSNTPQLESYETDPSYEYGKKWPRSADNSPIGNSRKCHFCIHRVEEGMLPACVTTCIGAATYFGDLNDPNSLVSELASRSNATRLKEELGTEPKVYYLT